MSNKPTACVEETQRTCDVRPNRLKTKRYPNGTRSASFKAVTRFLITFALVAVALPGATLQKLSFEEMVAKSTAIVRAKIGPPTGRQSGALVYTHHRISILETWKGNLGTAADIVVPGGHVGRLQQTVAGAPVLPVGEEMILFLWTSPKGLTHVIGLSQGVFQLECDAAGAITLNRGPLAASLVTAAGRPTSDDGMRMRLSEFTSRVSSQLGKSR